MLRVWSPTRRQNAWFGVEGESAILGIGQRLHNEHVRGYLSVGLAGGRVFLCRGDRFGGGPIK